MISLVASYVCFLFIFNLLVSSVCVPFLVIHVASSVCVCVYSYSGMLLQVCLCVCSVLSQFCQKCVFGLVGGITSLSTAMVSSQTTLFPV